MEEKTQYHIEIMFNSLGAFILTRRVLNVDVINIDHTIVVTRNAAGLLHDK